MQCVCRFVYLMTIGSLNMHVCSLMFPSFHASYYVAYYINPLQVVDVVSQINAEGCAVTGG